MCLVGSLPAEFVEQLPKHSYCIEYPRAPKTISGEWVPGFYRLPNFTHTHFVGNVTKGRTVTQIHFADMGLRVAEDICGFLWAALCAHLFKNCPPGRRHYASIGDAKSEWHVTYGKGSIHSIPFDRFGKPGSTFSLKNDESEFRLKLGTVPLVAELRGSDDSLKLVMSWLEQAGFPLLLT
jgi:hypothetical protein